jgi:DNA-binding CsgD family transcriptional regulator
MAYLTALQGSYQPLLEESLRLLATFVEHVSVPGTLPPTITLNLGNENDAPADCADERVVMRLRCGLDQARIAIVFSIREDATELMRNPTSDTAGDDGEHRPMCQESADCLRASVGARKSQYSTSTFGDPAERELVKAAEAEYSRQVSASLGGLTARQREIVAFVMHGMSNKDIAKRLAISPRTVAAHLDHIRNRLAVQSRTEIAVWAVTNSPIVAETGLR